jgi:hypothetical protein
MNNFEHGGMSMKPSMVCYECGVYTKDYDVTGQHVCGNEVLAGNENVDLDYEGQVSE